MLGSHDNKLLLVECFIRRAYSFALYYDVFRSLVFFFFFIFSPRRNLGSSKAARDNAFYDHFVAEKTRLPTSIPFVEVHSARE